ncbi:hypothetical protein CY34DRAFT_106846 [Suillus luteus UH-Slu-Lm8-n1]|uniref:Uncharacterized protein n=1 Tax=Suillus luteus UH-Slu-Lm8-n1 TaxID=930992 RepID=A0A0D0AXK0_9AGAM|nr:hypothetical protein CY34DRAFT_106846 [Suillus luteus UH-Slu-Lm8-n1]
MTSEEAEKLKKVLNIASMQDRRTLYVTQRPENQQPRKWLYGQDYQEIVQIYLTDQQAQLNTLLVPNVDNVINRVAISNVVASLLKWQHQVVTEEQMELQINPHNIKKESISGPLTTKEESTPSLRHPTLLPSNKSCC